MKTRVRTYALRPEGKSLLRRHHRPVRSGQKTESVRSHGLDHAIPGRSFGIILSASVVWLAVFGTGSALACKLTDPGCVVDKVEETAQDTVEDVQNQADETVKEVTHTADETVEDVKETASRTVEDVQETVDETVNQGGGTNPTAPNPPTDPIDRPKGDDRPGRPNDRPNNKSGPDVLGRGEAAAGPRERIGPLLPPIAPALDFSTPTFTETNNFDRPADPGLVESAIEAAKDFAFPLLLTLIVGAFLVIQHRVDRDEPKLVFAPIDHDLLSFE